MVDVLDAVLAARGNVAVGSQQSLTQGDEEEARLGDAVAALKEEDLRVTLRAHAEEVVVADFVKAVFRGSGVAEEAGLRRRLVVYEEIFELAQQGVRIRRDAVCNFLLVEVHTMPTTSLAVLIEKAMLAIGQDVIIVTNFPEDRWSPFEFLPAMLVRMLDVPKGGVDPKRYCKEELTSLNGCDYANYIIEEICSRSWPINGATMIVSTLAELAPHFSSSATDMVVQKAMAQIPSMSYSSIPNLFNNVVLLLTTACKPQQQVDGLNQLIRILEGLNYRYETEEGKNAKEDEKEKRDDEENHGSSKGKHSDESELRSLLQCEGAILSSFYMAIAKHLDLGRAFIASCLLPGNGVNNLTTLRVAFLISLARIKRLEARVLQVFENRVARTSQQAHRARSSDWLNEWWMKGFSKQKRKKLLASNQLSQRSDGLDLVFEELVEFSHKGGWDTVVESLSSIAIKFMDSSNVIQASHLVSRDVRIAGNELMYPDQERIVLNSLNDHFALSELGLLLLSKAFSKHSIVQRNVLACIKARISSASGSLCEKGVAQMLRLLAYLVDNFATIIRAEMKILKDILATLPKCAPRVASGFLIAIEPIFRAKVGLEDFAVLVFRKALFQRDVEPRLVAITGLLHILRSYEMSDASTEAEEQARVERQIDIINSLHRCLSHQGPVKGMVYCGLGAFTPKSAEVRRTLVSLLETHLNGLVQGAGSDSDSSSSDETSDEDEMKLDENENAGSNQNESKKQKKRTHEEMGERVKSGAFPFAIDRDDGSEILDPLYHLLFALEKQGSSEILERVSGLVASSSDVCACAKSPLQIFICESLIHFSFDDDLWNVLCDSMQAYVKQQRPAGKATPAKKKPKTSQNKTTSSKKKSAKKKKREGASNEKDASVSEEESRSDPDASVEVKRTPAGVPCRLSIEQLLDILKNAGSKPRVASYVCRALADRLSKYRETRRMGSDASAQAVVGISSDVCEEIAFLAAGHPPSSPSAVIQSVGYAMASLIFNNDAGDVTVEMVAAFRICAEIASDLDVLREFSRQALVRAGPKKANKEAEEDEEEDEIDFVSKGVELLCRICDQLLEASKPRATVLSALLGTIRILALKTSDKGEHATWTQETFMEAACENTKLADSALSLFIRLKGALRFGTRVLAKFIQERWPEQEFLNQIEADLEEEEIEENDKGKQERKKKTSKKQMDIEASAKDNEDVGKPEEDDEDHPSFEIVSDKVRSVAIASIVAHCNEVLEECEWAVSQMRNDPVLVVEGDEEMNKPVFQAFKRRGMQMKLVYQHLADFCSVMVLLMKTALPDFKVYEQLIRSQTRFYKLLSNHLKALYDAKYRVVPSGLKSLLSVIKTNTKLTYSLNFYLGGQTSQTSSNVAKEVKLMPLLVFQIEHFDMHLLKFSRLQNEQEREALSDQVHVKQPDSFSFIKGPDKKKPKKKKKEKARSESTQNSVGSSSVSKSATQSSDVT